MTHANSKKWLWLDILAKGVTLLSAVVAAVWTTFIYWDQRSLEREPRITSVPKLVLGSPDASGISRGTFSLDITNTSKVDVEVSWVLIHWFRGSRMGSKPSAMWIVNDPPDKYTGLDDSGFIHWDEIDHKLFTYYGWQPPPELAKFKPQGGGGTKRLRSGDSCTTSYDFFVDTATMDFIGFSASFGINKQWVGDNLFHAAVSAPIAKVVKQAAIPGTQKNSMRAKRKHPCLCAS